MYECLICSKPVADADYKPEFCCNGYECGCRGVPTNPCVCSDACEDALYSGIGKEFEQRRIDAGIERFSGDTESQQRDCGVEGHVFIGNHPD